ncbi:DNA methyltransferase family protein [Legionella longbeachae]|uniref:type I restriction-modification system subunit M n=1 Tax=Legionella longbeachae TaxID=450 RepID=UPI0012451938|nr:type I restriction-modification system subunit M [Legionella longbeachae]QEY51386.1 hypothetical protein FQU71_09105 [Legionella longbeachae]
MNVLDELWKILKESRDSRNIPSQDMIYDVLNQQQLSSVDLQNLKPFFSSLPLSGGSALFVDIQLAKLINMMMADFTNKNVLIPWADFGILPKYLIENNNVNSLDIVSISSAPIKFLLNTVQNGNVLSGEPFYILEKSQKKYDAIIGVLPFNRKVDFEYKSIRNNYEDILIALCIDKLHQNGKAAFIVSPSFFRGIGNNLFNQLKKFDIHLEAVIDLPSGIFKPVTAIKAFLIVLSKNYADKVFLAPYVEDESEQNQLVKNYLEFKDGKNIRHGIWHTYSNFKTFSELEHEHRIIFLATRSSLEKISFKEIVKDIKQINSAVIEKDHNENCIYFNHSLNKDVFGNIDNFIGIKNQKILRIELDSNKSSPDFLVEYFNINKLGKMIKRSFYQGITLQTLKTDSLLNSYLYLPTKTIQSQIENTCTAIKSLKQQLKELEEKIWQYPNQISKHIKELESLNEDATKNIWVDELPFPLASILWLYYSDTTSEDKTCYERLLHFFEAFCEFMTVIHLSIYESNPELWDVISEPLKQELRDKNFNLEIATFGTWLTILERLVKQSRKLLNENETSTLIKRSYCIEDTNLLNEFFGKKIISILKETINLRNSYSGHGGIISEKQAIEIHNKLKTKLVELRESMTGIWDNYKLIIPENSRYDSNYFVYNARNITGSKTPFGRIELMSLKPMQDGKLHIYSKETNTPFELLPFIRVVPSPKTELDACYFYNRMEKRGNEKLPRFISYHFEVDSEQYLQSEKISQFLNKIKD